MRKNLANVTEFIRRESGPITSIKPLILAEFEDKFGDIRVIHRTRSGIRVKNNRSTVPIELNRRVAILMAGKIRQRRLDLGLTLEEVAIRSGMVSTTAKSRMWEIENCQAKQGLRFGTLYALAIGLQTIPDALMPTIDEVLGDDCAVIADTGKTLRVVEA